MKVYHDLIQSEKMRQKLIQENTLIEIIARDNFSPILAIKKA